ncbi:MAG: Hsp20/alpha crystallin family protein [Alphaproteobacteria bacterium]|jgi:HSP20 family protein|nr:Hsp20/alpha crystallin family protein [Alphaproteobacteria bacterium]MCK5623360.1 Hsp20/alpha crystallin family protein [Alphaproteobacteria bacterium]
MATKITPRHEGDTGKHVPAPFESLTGLRDEMNHLFDEFFTGFERRAPSLFRAYEPGWLLGGRRGELTPAVDVAEDDKAVTLTAELPGMKEEDVEVVLRDDMLTVKGEKKSEREEKKENYHLTERRYGAFERTFRLPETADADKIKAAIEDGVLTVTVPKKAEAKVKAEKKIKIGK